MALTKVTTGGIKDGTITNEDISTTTSISQDKLAAKPGASSIASGLMTSADKNKLDGVADNANNYSHPSAHTIAEVTGLQGLLDGKTTETYVNTKVADLVDSSPATLDTLAELAGALGDDPNFATTVTNSIGTKLPLAGGTMTGSISNFTSTGIDDNAAGNRLIITDTGLGINTTPSVMLDIGASGKPGEIRVTNNVYDSWILQKRRSDNTQICGIKESGSGGLSFLVNGAAEKLRITSAGKVGIATTAPAYPLDIRGSSPRVHCQENGSTAYASIEGGGSASYLRFGTGDLLVTGNGTEYLRITSSGNVGIGTSSPTSGYKLDVSGNIILSSANPEIRFNNGGAYLGNANTANTLTVNTSGIERMRITSSGKVGIGTSSPYSALQVGDPEDTTGQILTIASRYHASTGGPVLNFRSGHPSNSNVWDMGRILVTDDGNYNGKIHFQTSDSGMAAPTTKMTIKSSGNVGIGTSNPSAKLDVAGVIRATNVQTFAERIDLTALSNTMYYPVVLHGGSNNTFNNYELTVNYGSNYLASVFCKFDFSGFSWGGNPVILYVDSLHQTYVNLLGAIGVVGYYKPVMYLKGGKNYYIKASSGVTPDIVTSINTNYSGYSAPYNYTIGPISEATMQANSNYLGMNSITTRTNKTATVQIS